MMFLQYNKKNLISKYIYNGEYTINLTELSIEINCDHFQSNQQLGKF